MQIKDINNNTILDPPLWINPYKVKVGLNAIKPMLYTDQFVRNLFLFVILISGGNLYGQQSEPKLNPTDVSISSIVDKKSLVASNDSYSFADKTNNTRSAYTHKHRGKRNIQPVKITNSRYVSHSIIKRSIGPGNEVRIRMMKNGVENTDIEDFSIAYDSGNEYRMNNLYGIQNTSLPLYVKVTYRSWNAFHAVQSDVVFEFAIYSAGIWDVTLFN